MSHKTLTKFCEVALFRNSLLQCCAAVIAGRFFMFSGNCISSYTLPYEWYRMSLIVPLDSKEIQPVSRTGNQSWIFIGRTDAEAETPMLWSPDLKNCSFENTLMLGKIEGRRRRGWQDEMVGWHHWLIGLGLSKLGVGEGQGGLACCSLWGHKESDTTDRLNNNMPKSSVGTSCYC